MIDLPDWLPTETADETTYAQGRRPDRTYISSSFPLVRPGSPDHGQPARFIIKVFDPESESIIEQEGEAWILKETPKGRYQVKFLVAREAGNIKQISIERVPAAGSGEANRPLLTLTRADIPRFLELIQLVDSTPTEGNSSVRIDDEMVSEILSRPDQLLSLYTANPAKLRELIENDVSANDVIALASRREAVAKFAAMLTDDDYFNSLVPTEGSGSPERVWQTFFESNPWILGLSVASQLLTSWDERRLEQIVDGHDISGGGKRVDALMRTTGRIRSMVLLEIKTHRASLLGVEYRKGCWAPSSELIGGVAQIQGTVHRAVKEIGERVASHAGDGSEIPNDFTYLIRPRSLLVIGKLDELQGEMGGDHADKIRSFELFRRSTLEPEVVTFDELYQKALFIVEHGSETFQQSSDESATQHQDPAGGIGNPLSAA
jgi:hypothetical protein